MKAPTSTSQPASGAASARQSPISPQAVVAIVIGIYFGAILAGQILVSLLPLAMGWSADRTERWLSEAVTGQFAFVVAVEAVTLLILFWVMRHLRISLRDIGLVWPRIRDIGITLLAYPPYFVLNAISALAANALLHVDLDQPQQTGFEQAAVGPELILTFISLVILPPIVEEIVMRGFLFSNLKRAMPVVRAAIVTSIIFAVAHLQFGSGAPLLWAAAIDTFVLSLVLCYLRHKTGSLWPGIFLHALKNGLAFFVIFIYPLLR